jgi:hypothetical protein
MLPLPRISATPKTNLAKESNCKPNENKARHAWILIGQVQRTHMQQVISSTIKPWILIEITITDVKSYNYKEGTQQPKQLC